MLNELRRRMDEHNEEFNKELENIKKIQSWRITAIKKKYTRRNQQEIIPYRGTVNEPQDRVVEITKAEPKKEF